VGELLATNTRVYMKKVKGHVGIRGNEGADRKAAEGAAKEAPDTIDLSRGEILEGIGLNIRSMTQALAYTRIRDVKKKPPCRRTARTLELVQAAVSEQTEVNHTLAAVWRSIKHRKDGAFTQKFSSFAWKTLHEGHKIGRFWEHTRVRDEYMPCDQCDVPEESMTHILFDCRVSGQSVVWKLAERLWRAIGREWPHISLGLVLGLGLVEIKDETGRTLKGRTRLFRILISESAYLIWVLQCEWRIGREQDPTKLHSETEVTAWWKRAMERRLRVDWALTNSLAYGKKALKMRLIEQTWHEVALDRQSIRSDLSRLGVLVGSGRVRRPPGRHR
jgi:hypothetical protein